MLRYKNLFAIPRPPLSIQCIYQIPYLGALPFALVICPKNTFDPGRMHIVDTAVTGARLRCFRTFGGLWHLRRLNIRQGELAEFIVERGGSFVGFGGSLFGLVVKEMSDSVSLLLDPAEPRYVEIGATHSRVLHAVNNGMGLTCSFQLKLWPH